MLLFVLFTAVAPYPQQAWFEQDPKPVPVVAESIGNPLDYAGVRIGLDVRNVELPRGWEGGYRFSCRFPIIDYVSTQPLYLKQWAEERSASIVGWQRTCGIQAVWYADDFFDGHEQDLDQIPPGYDASEDEWGGARLRAESAAAAFRDRLTRSPFSGKYRDALAGLYRDVHRMWSSTGASVRDLNRTELSHLKANPGRYLVPDGARMAELTGDRDAQSEFIQTARKVEYGMTTGAAAALSVHVSEYVALTAGWGPADFLAEGQTLTRPFVLATPLGKLVVAGPGSDTFVSDAAVIIDIGGDDIYRNNAGANLRPGDISLFIDHSGDDTYDAPDSSYVQGSGFLGIGMLVDVNGNDVYRARHFSQGVGILGVGVLWDKAGSDTFSAHAFCQGAGMFGFGMLLDDTGSDVYDCATMGQGSATTLGMGVLSDLGGNDQYRLACDTTKDVLGGIPGCGQGGALSFRAYPWEKKLTPYGGVGLLVDDKGNDDYVSKGWCSQGGSYIMSLGALVDNEGNDHYDCGTGQGSGIHVTNAILIDKKGDDVYEGGFRSGGSGGDRSPGFLIDYEGNDTYKSATSSYGTGCKPFSYSLFIDYKGDDRYICARPESTVLFNDWHSFGGVWPESDPNLWPYAISLDLGGNDDYEVRNRRNNSETHSFGHGIHLDMEWTGGDVIGPVRRLPVRGWLYWPMGDTTYRAIPKTRVPDDLGSYFSFRFNSVGRLVGSGPRLLPDVVKTMLWASDVPNVGWNQTLMEVVHYWLVQGKLTDRHVPELVKVLKKSDLRTRIVIADDLGLWALRRAEDALVEAAGTDSVGQVRRFALRSLMRLESKQGLGLARRLATEDTCEDVRRVAVSYVSRVRDSVDVFPLLRWALAEDKASSVKCAAADGIRHLQDARGIEPLRAAAQTYDVYVQRACGRALAELGQADGVQMLISSLSFPSIDAFYNYDRNVPNYISAYCGLDLPEPDRYVQAKWQEWFDAHKDSIDLSGNVAAFRALGAVTDSVRDSSGMTQAARYSRLHERFPSSERVRKALAAKLNEVAWGMVTGAKPDVRTGLDCARRAVELVDDPNYWDTLIEAYLANNQKAQALVACNAALARYPDNHILKDRLKQCEERQ